jgi:hypothetical protein
LNLFTLVFLVIFGGCVPFTLAFYHVITTRRTDQLINAHMLTATL